MRNRLNKWSKHTTAVVCLLALGGAFAGCSDDYELDEVKPSYLNESIYETLVSSQNHEYYLRLIADPELNSGLQEGETPELVEILKRTGSRTVFAADDDAWKAFFQANAQLPASNPWHNATCYEYLSKAQKLLLLNTSMLPNAIVMENLASSTGIKPTRGETLRHMTKAAPTDTISLVAISDLFQTRWSEAKQKQPVGESNHPEVDQWARIKNGVIYTPESKILMSQDSSQSMMIHFTNEYMSRNQITDNDFRILMNGETRSTGDVHIYDAKLDSADIVCQNGYLEYTAKPLVPLANMSEIIRTNGETNIFSHIMERFSVPFHSTELARQYRQLHPEFKETDTLYVKRYYSERSYGSTSSYNREIRKDWKGRLFANDGLAILKFDPGWNAYFPYGKNATQDLGALFVPSDNSMLKYFQDGGGRVLIEEYTKDPYNPAEYGTDEEGLNKLFDDIDQIPLTNMAKIINHGMFKSFVESVPSKMLKLSEADSQEDIFSEEDTRMESDGGNIHTVKLACNGPVYIMNNVYTPSDFDCVATPAFIKKASDNKIMYWSIYSDKDLGSNAIMGINYYAYLKAMKSCFTFFLPTDKALKYNYDPMSFSSNGLGRVMRMLYTGKGNFPFVNGSAKTQKDEEDPSITWYVLSNYDVNAGVIGKNQTLQGVTQGEIVNRLRQMLEHNTIVHETLGTDYYNNNGRLVPFINEAEDEFYLSKNGMGIRVIRDNGQVVAAQGGFQLENQREFEVEDPLDDAAYSQGVLSAKVQAFGDYKNGYTFTMNAPLIPAARSVWSVLSNVPRGFSGSQQSEAEGAAENNPYQKFYEICDHPGIDLDQVIKKSGLVDETKYDINNAAQRKQLNAAVAKYSTFEDKQGVDYNVSFWQNYNYTIFAPTNEAMDNAYAYTYTDEKGEHQFPTWEDIINDFDNCEKDDEGNLIHREDSLRLQANIVWLTNFVRLHFADNSVFADKSNHDYEMISNSFDNQHNVFTKLYVKRQNGVLYVSTKKDSGYSETVPEVTVNGNIHNVRNIMTCDRSCSQRVKKAVSLNGITVDGSNYAVVHMIDGFLMPERPDFSTEARLCNYIEKFKIR
ncbi:MAG: hypothetical protein II463_03070 [Bacteroidaceae bacterium]|nr:hypothetical protein [Bacteroidaceae bacterium]